jgi:hypothetical protein
LLVYDALEATLAGDPGVAALYGHPAAIAAVMRTDAAVTDA